MPTAATPVTSPASGTYPTDQLVTISDSTSGATIYYTLSLNPGGDSGRTKYTGPISVSGTGTQATIVAYASADGMKDSSSVTAVINIDYGQVGTPAFNPSQSSTFNAPKDITITSSPADATIYYSYTTDGSTPTDPDPTNAATYDGQGLASGTVVSVSGTGTVWKIKAIAVKSGMINSTIGTSGTYTVIYPAAAAPSFNKAAGTYTVTNPASISVTVTNNAGAGTSVSYTTDGSQPTSTHGTVSALSAFAVSIATTNTTLKAVAFGGSYSQSGTTSATYGLKAQTPQFNLSAGPYTGGQTVNLSTTTAGATIMYTTDGSTPTASHGTAGTTVYVGVTTTVKAIAYETGLTASAASSATYTITGYAIGDSGPAHGIVFYDAGSYTNGWRYLEAAPSDQSTGIVWGEWGTSIAGTSTNVGKGYSNTNLIIGTLEPLNLGYDYAARICANLVLNGYSDWFLPSLSELVLMYSNLYAAGRGGLSGTYYWSSSEHDGGNGWYELFAGNTQGYTDKRSDYYVRAIREF